MAEAFNFTDGLCRCCHAQGSFKSLSETFVVEGQKEIYSVLIQESFDINVSIRSFIMLLP